MTAADLARAMVATWHRVVAGEVGLLDELLADDVVFYSPVVFTPQRGKAVTTLYLRGALEVLSGAGFGYTRQLVVGRQAVLEFETTVDAKHVNGVDILECDEAGRVVEFRVMLRPLQAVHAVHERMAALLSAG